MFQDELKLNNQLQRQRARISTKNIDPGLINVVKTLVEEVDELVLEQNVKELQKRIGIKKIDRRTQTFKDLIHYLRVLLNFPNSSLALLHRDSYRLGNFDRIDQERQAFSTPSAQNINLIQSLQNCPCCGFIRQQQQLKVCTDHFKQASDIGISTYMFFRTMRNLIYLLLVALIVFGVFSFATNVKSSENWNTDFTVTPLQFNNTLMISLASKIYYAKQFYQVDYLTWQVWLGFAFVVILMFAYLAMEYVQVTEIAEVQNLSKSAADYTVVMSGVPTDITQEDIQGQLDKLAQKRNKRTASKKSIQSAKTISPIEFKILKINLGTPIDIEQQVQKSIKQELVNLQRKYQSYQKQIISWIYELRQSQKFETSAEQRHQVELKFLVCKKLRAKKHQQIVSKVKELYNVKKGSICLTDVFVTFSSQKTKEKLLEIVKKSAFQKFLHFITLSLIPKRIKMSFNRYNQEYQVIINQASEPEDVIWKNIGMQPCQLFIRKCVTFLITFILLGMSFAAVYGLQSVRVNADTQKNNYISFLISLIIGLFNFLITFTLQVVTYYQLNLTQTQYQSSIAVKAIIAKLVNTILIPIVVNRFLKTQSKFYESDGMPYNVFMLGLTMAFLDPLIKIFDIYYLFIKYFRVWWYQDPGRKFYLNQVELNKVYELMPFEDGIQYIYIVSLYLFTCFYMPIQPVIIVFAIVGYILNYWAQKYSLFHRCKRPVPGTKILYDTMVQFIYAGGLFYSLGSLSFINFLPQDLFRSEIRSALIANIITACFGFIALFIPFSLIYESLFKRNQNQDQLYDDNRIFLPSQYDRLNPATSDEALPEYLQFVSKKRAQLISQSRTNQGGAIQVLDLINKMAKNNYSKTSTIGIFGSDGWFKTTSKAYNQLMNPKVETLGPKLLEQYFMGELVDQVMVEKIEQDILKQDPNLGSSQIYAKPQKHLGKLQHIKHSITQVGRNILNLVKPNDSSKPTSKNSLYQPKSQDYLNYGKMVAPLQSAKSSYIHALDEEKFTDNPLKKISNLFDAEDINQNDPLRRTMNYKKSPYTPEMIQRLKMNKNQIRKKSLVQLATQQPRHVVERAIFKAKSDLKNKSVLKKRQLNMRKQN